MHWYFRAAILVFLIWLTAPATVRADPFTFRFAGRVDTTTGIVPPSVGDVLFGSVNFDIPGTNAPPGDAIGFFQTRDDVFRLSFAHAPGAPAFDERTLRRQLFSVLVFNNVSGDIPGPFDELGIFVSTFTFPQFNFTIDLIDRTGSIFTNANLPTSPNLDAFQLRNFVGSIQVRRGGTQEVVGTFGGTITSLLGGPGPSTLPEPGTLSLLGPAALVVIRRARLRHRLFR